LLDGVPDNYFFFVGCFSFVSFVELSFVELSLAPDSFDGESFLSCLSDFSDFSFDDESDDPLSRALDFPA